MIGVVAASLLTLVAGLAAARAQGRPAPIGAAYLYGCGVITLAFTLLPWVRWSVALVVVASIITLVLVRDRSICMRAFRASPVDALTAIVLALFAGYSTVARLWEWDAWAIWAMKARAFFEYGGIDWAFMEKPSNFWLHGDYPLLVPANLALPAIVAGEWNDRWLGLIGVFILAAAVLVVRELTARRFAPSISALIAFAVAGLGASSYVGTAETPLLALSLAALACLHAEEHTAAAILLGLAASTKNEGVALLAAVLLVHAFAALRATAAGVRDGGAWQRVRHLCLAAAIVAPWFILRALHALPTDLASGSVVDRLTSRLGQAGPLLRDLATFVEKPALWVVLAVVTAFYWRRAPMLFAIAALQIVFCVTAYFVTPYDLSWHIATSWERVSRQLVALAAYAAMVALATQFSSAEVTHAQARSEQQ